MTHKDKYFPDGKGNVKWETEVKPTIDQAITSLNFVADITIWGGRRDRLAGNFEGSDAFEKLFRALISWLEDRFCEAEDGVSRETGKDIADDVQKLLELADKLKDQGLESGIHIMRMHWIHFAEMLAWLIDDYEYKVKEYAEAQSS